MTIKELEKVFNSWDNYYKHIHTNGVSFREILNWVTVQEDFLKAILDERPRNVLEIGIGSGIMSLYLSKMGLNVTSIDNNHELIIRVLNFFNEYGSNIALCLTDAFNLAFPDDSFDVVFHQGLFEHFSDQDLEKLLSEQLRVGRSVIFSVPTVYYPRKDFGNERLLTKESWERIFANFNITKSVYYYYRRPSIEYRRFKLYTSWGQPEHYYMKIER